MRLSDLNVILADIDEAEMPDGTPKTFKIGFITKFGEFKYFAKARKAGTSQHAQRWDFKGVEPLGPDGKPIDHIHPVLIHTIVYYSGTVTFSAI